MSKKFIILAIAVMAAPASAQYQSYCNRSGSQVSCQTYDTGAPAGPGETSNTVVMNGHQQTFSVYQPVMSPPPPQDHSETQPLNWNNFVMLHPH